LFVTHAVNEAAFIGDRIVVMSHRPGTISAVLTNDAPRPRTFDSPAVMEQAAKANEILKAEVQWSTKEAFKL